MRGDVHDLKRTAAHVGEKLLLLESAVQVDPAVQDAALPVRLADDGFELSSHSRQLVPIPTFF